MDTFAFGIDDLEMDEFCLCFIWSIHPLHDRIDIVFLLILPLSVCSLEYDSILHRDDESDDEGEEESDLRAGGEVHERKGELLRILNFIPSF